MMSDEPLLQIHSERGASGGVALLAKGFRPFFLLAAAWAVVAMLLWLAVLSGAVELGSYFGTVYWHAHEMIFGYTVAVIAGFLLTAVGNWTGIETARGPLLAALAAVWLLGRLAVLCAAHLPEPVAAILDLSFLPLLGLTCARPLWRTSNRRNYPFLLMLAALFLANLSMHLGALGIAPLWIRRGAWVAVDIVILMIIVMTARIVPMFTRNASGAGNIRNLVGLDYAAAAGAVALILLDASNAEAAAWAALPLALGLIVAARSLTWGSAHTLREPLLWILHSGHAFVALGLVLRGVAVFVPQLDLNAALHALTAGAIALLTLGMMARVSLGHTGRKLAAGMGLSTAFALLLLGALLRVFGPQLGATMYHPTMMASGILFSLAFFLFLLIFGPLLSSPRPDGRPG